MGKFHHTRAEARVELGKLENIEKLVWCDGPRNRAIYLSVQLADSLGSPQCAFTVHFRAELREPQSVGTLDAALDLVYGE